MLSPRTAVLASLAAVFALEILLSHDPVQVRAAESASTGAELQLPPRGRDCSCSATFTSYSDTQNVTLCCSLASGVVTGALPLIFQGNYELCSTFPATKFCTVETPPLLIPLDVGRTTTFRAGSVLYSACISSGCDADDVLEAFMARGGPLDQVLDAIDDTILATHGRYRPANRAAREIRELVAVGSLRYCADLTAEQKLPNQAGTAALSVAGIIAAFVLAATSSEPRKYPHEHPFSGQPSPRHASGSTGEAVGALPRQPGLANAVMRTFGAFRNMRRLSAPRNALSALDGIKVAALLWVMYARTLQGTSESIPVLNPSAIQRLATSKSKAVALGATFSIDTLLFIGGFLAVQRILRAYDERHASLWRMYSRVVPMRVARVLPAYVFVLLFAWRVTPLLGYGPFWKRPPLLEENCNEYFWANLLFLNNLVPFREPYDSGQVGCLAWTWYIALDFQLFCFVPAVVHLFVRARTDSRLSPRLRWLLMWGPSALAITCQLVTTLVLAVHFDMTGEDAAYKTFVEVKPYSRCAPYVVGVIAAMVLELRTLAEAPGAFRQGAQSAGTEEMLHEQALQGSEGPSLNRQSSNPLVVDDEEDEEFELESIRRKILGRSRGVVALVVMSIVVGARYYELRCTLAEPDCDEWLAFETKLGYLWSPNWNRAGRACYLTFAPLLWSAALAVFCFTLIRERGWRRVSWFFSSSIFRSLSQLVFSAYLLHAHVVDLLVKSRPACESFSLAVTFAEFVCVAVVSFAGALVLWIGVEAPSRNIIEELWYARRAAPPAVAADGAGEALIEG